MTVTAIDAVVAHVVLVTELNRLLALDVARCSNDRVISAVTQSAARRIKIAPKIVARAR